jgi:hypothetical protein
MENVKRTTEYYLKIPGKYVYLSEDNPCDIKLSGFSDNAKMLNKDDAVRLSERYGLDVIERITTTTTVVQEKIFKEDK